MLESGLMFNLIAGDAPSPGPVHFSAGLVVFFNRQGRPHLLLVDGRLPAAPVADADDSATAAGRLFLALTGVLARTHPLSSGVVDVQFALLRDDPAARPDVVAVYGAVLQGETALLVPGAAWVPFDRVADPALAGLAADVGRRL